MIQEIIKQAYGYFAVFFLTEFLEILFEILIDFFEVNKQNSKVSINKQPKTKPTQKIFLTNR